MSRIQDDALVAYVDGELDPDWKSEVERSMAADPSLAEKAQHHTLLREVAEKAFGAALNEPVPARLLRAAGGAAQRAQAGADAPFDPRHGRLRFGPAHLAAMAACLAVGLLAGRFLLTERSPAAMIGGAPSGPGPIVADAAGRLEARGQLLKALEGQLSTEQGEGKVRLGFSFRTAEGDYCRTFQMVDVELAGLACKTDGRWGVRMTTPGHADARDDLSYRVAAAPMPPAVLVTVDAMIDGAPLDGPGEEAARAQDWAR